MPLAEIRRFLADCAPARLDEYELALADELVSRREVLAYVRRLLEEEPMFEVQTKQVESLRYVGRTKRVRVPELKPVHP